MLTFIRYQFHPRVTAVARKRPRSFCQKCRWQVAPKHAYTLYPAHSGWADHAAVQAWCGNLSEDELTRKSSGNLRPQSFQLAQPLWADLGIKSAISVRELISTSKKKKKKPRPGANGGTFPKTFASEEKTTTTIPLKLPPRALMRF